MVAERLRLFVGSTELNYSDATITESNDYIIDRGTASVEADTDVTSAAVIDFKESDGLTTVFSARVIDKQKEVFWKLQLMTNGYELNNLPIETVWENKSPEYIVQDIVDNYTNNLVFASTSTSGITLTKYIADGYALDIIKDMMDILQWELVIDKNDNVYFQPKGEIDNGVTFTNGSGVTTENWKEDQNALVNHVKIIGGFESFALQETISGTGTVFTLSKKPQGSMRILDGATEVSPEDYEIDAPNKTVTFDSSITDPFFDYTYNRPIIVENQNDASISTYGEVFRKINCPWLDSFDEARRYAQNVLDALSEPLKSVTVNKPYLDFDVRTGETVTVIDDLRSETEVMVINSVTWNARDATTTYACGSPGLQMYDWQREVQERVKKLERRFANTEDTIYTRLFKENILINITRGYTWEKASPTNTFWLNHKTLSRLRTVVNGSVYNFEPDCSDNGNNGTWYGTGISGSQFTTSGWRLSAGTFNGTDNYVEVLDDSTLNISSDISIAFSLKMASLPSAETLIFKKTDGTDGYKVILTSDNKAKFIYYTSSTESSVETTNAITAASFNHLTFVKDATDLYVYVDGVLDNSSTGESSIGTSSENLLIGKDGSNYTTMTFDELRIYNRALDSDEITDLVTNQFQINEGMKIYLSFDDPRLGIRMGSRTSV